LAVKSLPRGGHIWYPRSAAKLVFGAGLACHPRDFGREVVELLDHGVDHLGDVQILAAWQDYSVGHANTARQRILQSSHSFSVRSENKEAEIIPLLVRRDVLDS